MSAEEDRSDRSTFYQHEQLSIGASTTVTFHAGTGTDSATDRYLGLPSAYAYGTKVIPTASISITKINDVSLKSAIPVGTGGWSSGNTKIRSITLQTGNADVTSVEMRS